eukprot:scaffold570_cov382-Prasinococcus_capsulatus_cf.AAC.4
MAQGTGPDPAQRLPGGAGACGLQDGRRPPAWRARSCRRMRRAPAQRKHRGAALVGGSGGGRAHLQPETRGECWWWWWMAVGARTSLGLRPHRDLSGVRTGGVASGRPTLQAHYVTRLRCPRVSQTAPCYGKSCPTQPACLVTGREHGLYSAALAFAPLTRTICAQDTIASPLASRCPNRTFCEGYTDTSKVTGSRSVTRVMEIGEGSTATLDGPETPPNWHRRKSRCCCSLRPC